METTGQKNQEPEIVCCGHDTGHNMADKNKEAYRSSSMEPATGLGVEEAPNIDATDDFDPLSGVVECVEEHLDIALNAPPETE